MVSALVDRWQARRFWELKVSQVCLLAARFSSHRCRVAGGSSRWVGPWGFNPLTVLLTAAHFHHASFTLPLIAGLNAQAEPCRWNLRSCYAILAGMPLVAVGINCTHLSLAP